MFKPKSWITLTSSAALFAGLAVSGLQAVAEESQQAPASRQDNVGQRVAEQKARVDDRSQRLRKAAEARRFLSNPWAEWDRRAWQAHSDAMRQAFEYRRAWDQAAFDNYRHWVDPWADTHMAWMEQRADGDQQFFDNHMNYLERVTDAEADWFLAHQPLPPVPVYGPVWW